MATEQTKPCPECGKKMVRAYTNSLLLSSPQQHPWDWRCGCGYVEHGGVERAEWIEPWRDDWERANDATRTTPRLDATTRVAVSDRATWLTMENGDYVLHAPDGTAAVRVEKPPDVQEDRINKLADSLAPFIQQIIDSMP